MFKNVAKVYVAVIIVMSITSQVVAHYVDKATAQQCRTHDWPTAAHQVHMDWCADNNYTTK